MQKKTLLNILKLKSKDNIREIYLFGSVARGDDDDASDIDILIIIDNCSEEDYLKYKNYFSKLLEVPVSWISLYRYDKILSMYENGSYFLWHIKVEGKKLYSKNNELSGLLENLPRYHGMVNDIKEYTQILEDIHSEMKNKYICVEYELSVMASLVRNTCIMLSYLNDRLDFSRTFVVKYCIEKYGIDVTIDEYKRLYMYRHYETGKLEQVPSGKLSDLKKWLSIEKQLLYIAVKEVKLYEKTVISGME